MKAAFTGPSAFFFMVTIMNMMSHTAFSAHATVSAPNMRSAEQNRGASEATQNFALLLAMAAARAIQHPATRVMQAKINRMDHHLHTDIDHAERSHAHKVMAILSAAASDDQHQPCNSSGKITASFAPSSQFGNQCESPVYHGVSNNVQTLAVNKDHQAGMNVEIQAAALIAHNKSRF